MSLVRDPRTRDVRAPFAALAGWCCGLITTAVAAVFLAVLIARGWIDYTHLPSTGLQGQMSAELTESAKVIALSMTLLIAVGCFAAVAAAEPAIGGASGRWLNAALRFGPAMPAIALTSAAAAGLGLIGGGTWYDAHPLAATVIALSAFNLPIVTERLRFVFRSIPRRWRIAAVAAGASPQVAFRRVALPKAWPGIAAVLLNGAGEMLGETVVVVVMLGSFGPPWPLAAALWMQMTRGPSFQPGTEAGLAFLVVSVVALRLAAGALFRRFGIAR